MDKPLQQRLREHKPSAYKNRQRSLGVHERMKTYISSLIAKLKVDYDCDHEFEGVAREHLRHCIRVYQDYVVKYNFTAHYVSLGGDGGHFEHALPMQHLTDLLLCNHITIDEALDSPTACVSSKLANALKKVEIKYNDTPYYPLRRYIRAAKYDRIGQIRLQTPFQEEVNLETWTLDDHYALVSRLWEELQCTGSRRIRSTKRC